MKIIALIKYLLAIVALIFIFINWKIAVGLFLLATIFYVIPLGVNALLGVMTGYFLIGGIISLFINWKISVIFVLFAFLTIKFRVWGNKATEEYKKETTDKKVTAKKPSVYTNEIGQSFTDEDLHRATEFAADLIYKGLSRPDALTQATEKYIIPRSAINSLLSTLRKVD